MKIVIFSHFFAPEMGAPAARFYDFSKLLLKNGHEVTVITGFPNFPSGIIPAEYNGKMYLRETYDGINLIRGFIYASPNQSYYTKGLGYITYTISSIIINLMVRIPCDVIIATSPPPTVLIGAILASKFRRVPLITDIRDIWPEAVINSNRIKHKVVADFFLWLEKKIYANSTQITVVSEGKRERLIERGVPADKINVIPNGVDFDYFEHDEDISKTLEQYGIRQDHFLVTYSGVFNPPQGLDVIIRAADIIKSRFPLAYEKTRFLFIGNGSEKDALTRLREELKLEHVIFIPEQPRKNIPAFLRSSDILLVTLRPRKDNHTVPSKVFEYLASGRPTIISANGEAVEIIKRSGGGLVARPGDAHELAENIVALYHNPDLLDEMGRKGRSYAERYFDRKSIFLDFLKVIEKAHIRRS